MALSKSESDYFGPEDVAPTPSFPVVSERRLNRNPLRMARAVIVEFNRRADGHIPTRDVAHKIFEPRPEPPIETLVRDMPNFPADHTSR